MSKASKQNTVTALKMVSWAVALLIGGLIVSGAMQRKQNAQVQGIDINIEPLASGNFLINEEDIPLILAERFAIPIETYPVGELDVERLERVLEEHPFVKEAEAYIDAENRINIELQQREPILRIMDNNGLNYYLDQDGEQMPPSIHYTARVRVATGNLPPYETEFLTDDDHLLQQIFRLNELLLADPFLDALVEQIYVNKRGEIILSPKIGKQTIQFGRYQDAENKLSRLKTFYREGLPYKGWQAYSSFDLRYEGQVVAKKR
jgi:cell division protein FtsQ